MSTVSSDSFTYFPVWMQFISFSCLITLAMTFNIMLRRMVKVGFLASSLYAGFWITSSNVSLAFPFISSTVFIILLYSLLNF